MCVMDEFYLTFYLWFGVSKNMETNEPLSGKHTMCATVSKSDLFNYPPCIFA